MTEPQVVRRPARFVRKTRAYLHNTPFTKSKDSFCVDKWKTRMVLAYVIAVLIALGLDTAWLLGWLK